MSFLKRLLGGGASGPSDDGVPAGDAAPTGAGSADTEETERERELLRTEAARLDNDLLQRQLRYADRKWTPPAQGGPERAEDGDRPAG